MIYMRQIEIGLYINNIIWADDNILNSNWENKGLMEKAYSIKRDLKMFNYFFNHINNKEKSRFQYEEFLDFENFNTVQNKKISGELKSNNKENENANSIDNDIKDIDKIDFQLAKQIVELGKDPFIFIIINSIKKYCK